MRDSKFWKNVKIPKLQIFYYDAILPELALPRLSKCPGIREPPSQVSISYDVVFLHMWNNHNKVNIHISYNYILYLQIQLSTSQCSASRKTRRIDTPHAQYIDTSDNSECEGDRMLSTLTRVTTVIMRATIIKQ